MVPQRLLLWDIDHTLVWTGGAGERALVSAAKEVCLKSLDLDEIQYSGRTDRWIAQTIIEHFKQEATETKQEAFQEAYLSNLALELPNSPARVLDGVVEILDTVAADENTCQALLTGNLERGAELKLGHLNLWDYFRFGSFAEASQNRNELSVHALALAEKTLSTTFDLNKVFVIGDTPYDIECGKVIGAQTIAVATGTHSYELLAEHAPDHLFKSLADTAAFLKIVSDCPPKQG